MIDTGADGGLDPVLLFLYFAIFSCFGNLALFIMWDLMEEQNYPVYLYDRIIYAFLIEVFLIKTCYIDGMIHPILNLVFLALQILAFYIVLIIFKEKKK